MHLQLVCIVLASEVILLDYTIVLQSHSSSRSEVEQATIMSTYAILTFSEYNTRQSPPYDFPPFQSKQAVVLDQSFVACVADMRAGLCGAQGA